MPARYRLPRWLLVLTAALMLASLLASPADSASGQTLTYSASGLPAGLSINSGTGLISGTPIAAGTSGATGSAAFTWSITGGTGGGTCQVAYTTQSLWGGGFVAGITITNTSTTAVMNGWTLAFTFPGDQQITTAWNGSPSQSGENVTIANASHNASIAAGPAAFTLNGTACTT
jgi:Cellulose binding domain/Putative Ig domain